MNSRSAASIQLEYLINIQAIKPWPPSPLLGALRSVLIQWENGESSSGCTRSVIPDPNSGTNGGAIEFNESFRLPVTLQKDMSPKPRTAGFLKNNLVLNLYEPRRDNIAKGKLIATAMIDLADYGAVDEALRIRAAINCKRNFRNMVQPFLYFEIQPIDKARTCSSSCGNLSISKEPSLTEIEGEPTAVSVNDEYADIVSAFSSASEYSGGFPTRDGEVKSSDEIFLQNCTNHLEENAKVAAVEEYPEIGGFSFSWGKFEMINDDVLTNNNVQERDESAKTVSDTVSSNHDDLEEEHDEGGRGPRDEKVKSRQQKRKDSPKLIHVVTDRRRAISNAKVQHMQRRIQMLEGELREAAALEVALYSVVAEHGNSTSSKVHAPARRLSRLYRHAHRELSPSRRASAARSALSGLVLVAKACGNDVPRLTYWLSNSIMLRAILSRAIIEKKSSPIGRRSFLRKEADQNARAVVDEDDELKNFLANIEKVEAWIFSRVIESIWWQILIPHMQSTAARQTNRDNNNKRVTRANEQAQADISLGIWKAAFKDACEQVCPVRGAGQKCGCLPLLCRLVMEQCVARLDVAMFNALLRESDDEIPTDPISDPISDPKVLPVPAGKLSFRAGAQLKNVIGNWSQWLTDLFGMDDNESGEDDSGNDTDSDTQHMPFKPFRLLYALSDLMMLPKDLLLNRSTRKEVCPTFGASVIRRALENFIPDEFCPDPVPEAVLEALVHEDPPEHGDEELIDVYPCTAAPPIYSPPSAASISAISRRRSNGSLMLMKSQNSDDELDEVSSPLASVSLHATSSSSPVSTLASSVWKEGGNRNVRRYELLRDIWMDCE